MQTVSVVIALALICRFCASKIAIKYNKKKKSLSIKIKYD